jgi:hypothetical protein
LEVEITDGGGTRDTERERASIGKKERRRRKGGHDG